MTPLKYLEIEDKELIKKLEKNLIRDKVTEIMNGFAKEYHKEQLLVYSNLGSKKDKSKTLNVLLEMIEAYLYYNKGLKELEPLGREYFNTLGRSEGVLNAIEIFTGIDV